MTSSNCSIRSVTRQVVIKSPGTGNPMQIERDQEYVCEQTGAGGGAAGETGERKKRENGALPGSPSPAHVNQPW